jgi:hypothetical protein
MAKQTAKQTVKTGPRYAAERLSWQDLSLGSIGMPRGRLRLSFGLGSGLTIRARDRTIWAIGDRGPNLKVEPAIARYGLNHLRGLKKIDGAKIMPRPGIGPAIAELRLEADAVRLVRRFPLRGASGRPISGLPVADTSDTKNEPAFDLKGEPLPADPSGADTEAIAACADGTFFVGDEYGPSVLRVDAAGMILSRWVPAGLDREFEGADYPVLGILPAIAARRRLNRGFEALALSPDERWLYAVFQSPLAHPGKRTYERARHVRLWKLDARTGALAAQFLYPLDAAKSFRRDAAAGKIRRGDIKVSEAAAIGPGRLLLLERISHSTKIYAVTLKSSCALAPEHLDPAARPTLEQMDAKALAAHRVPLLAKTLLLSTDDMPEIEPDLEGMAVLSPHELLLVTDNDFGVEGAWTHFWRIRFDEPVFAI